jgi:ABC-type nitrate/sulfonate/bicarbonate transport system substrate-binding protein
MRWGEHLGAALSTVGASNGRLIMLSARPAVSVVIVLAVLASLGGCAAPASAPAAAPAAAQQAPAAKPAAQAPPEPKLVRITMARSIGASIIWGMDQFATKYGLKTEYVAASTNADQQRNVQSGQVELATLGHHSPAMLADQGVNNVKVIAGLYSDGQNLIMRKGVDLPSWKDLEGKKIGRPPGTYVGILFTLAARVNGVDLSRVNILDTTASGTTELQALKNGDLDGFLMWGPAIDTAVVEGYGYYPPAVDIGSTKEYGNGNQILAANTDFLRDRQTVVTFLKAYAEAADYYTKNPDKWMDVAVQVTGADRAVLAEAIKHINIDYRMDTATAVNVAKYGAEFGFTKADQSAKVPEYIDFRYLSEATGQSVEQLTRLAQ